MRKSVFLAAGTALATAVLWGAPADAAVQAGSPRYDTSTLAGKVASLRGTAGLQVRFSAYVEKEAEEGSAPTDPVSVPNIIPSSPLDGTSVQAPAVTVNQDTAGAPQNETAIAVDPNNPNRIVASANDYVARTWACTIDGTPCSALGDGYSGTYFSNDGGASWCCTSSDPAHLGTLIPGVTRLAGGQYDAGGDPALAFDSRGTVYYAGLGFNRDSAPNTVTVNRGTFDAAGQLGWSAPTFINPTTSPAIFNDKEWIAADSHPSSPYRDRVYVTWTRFVFSAGTGAYVQSPIFFASSSDGGRTFTAPTSIVGNVKYDQGSRPVVGPDGSLYVFFEGATRKAALDSTYVVKSTRRRCLVGQAGRDLDAARHGGAARRVLPDEQLPGRGCCTQRRPLRDVDDHDGRRVDGGLQHVVRRWFHMDRPRAGLPGGQPDGGGLPGEPAGRWHAVGPVVHRAGRGCLPRGRRGPRRARVLRRLPW